MLFDNFSLHTSFQKVEKYVLKVISREMSKRILIFFPEKHEL